VLTKNQQILGQKIYDQTVMQQSEGMANLTDVLMADNALKEAQQSYFSASIDYLKAKAELKKVTGNFK
jgi:OMF family outer membrane factor